MISGNHLDLDACVLARSHRGDGLRSGRVDHTLQAQEYLTGLHIFVMDCRKSRGQFTLGKRQNAQSLAGHRRHLAVHCLGVKGDDLPVRVDSGSTAGQDHFGRALHIDQARLIHARIMQRDHILMLRLERDRIQPRKVNRSSVERI